MPFIDDRALGPRQGSRPGMIRPQWTEDLQRLYDRWRDVEENPIPTASSLRGDEERIIAMPARPPSLYVTSRRRGTRRSSRERMSFIRRLGACEGCRARKIKCKHLDLSVFEANYRDLVQSRLLDSPLPGSPAPPGASDTPALDALDSILAADAYCNPANTPDVLSGDSLSVQMSTALGQRPTWNGLSNTTTVTTQVTLPSVAAILQETSVADPPTIHRGPSSYAWPLVGDNDIVQLAPCVNCGQLVSSPASCTRCDPSDWSWLHDAGGFRRYN